MLFEKKLSAQDKLDFLEYLAFQVKSEMSFEKSLTRYISNGVRKPIVEEKCSEAIEMIKNGDYPADVLLKCKFIEKFEYGVVKNASSNQDLYASLISIININKSNLNNSNALTGAIRSGVLTICGLLLLIPFYKDDIAQLYGTFDQMQSMVNNNGQQAKVELPFLIRYWWGTFAIIGFFGIIWQGLKYLFKYLYEEQGHIYYRIFSNKLYMDLVSVLKTFYQLQQSMSTSNAYIALANSSPNTYWQDFFNDITNHLKQGGKASEIFSNQSGVLPKEVIYCFYDAEDTGEYTLYINKAIDFAETKNNEINKTIKEWSPIIINLILFSVVGYFVVSLVKDIMKSGVMDVMSKM